MLIVREEIEKSSKLLGFLVRLMSDETTPSTIKKEFRVSANLFAKLKSRKSRIERRIDKTKLGDICKPVFTASNIHFELSDKTRGFVHGGIGAVHLLVQKLGLAEAIDQHLHLLKIHLPYHESDHVLNIAYNALCDGICLQDIELRRTDEVFLDALGAQRIPDPTTAGDFCRRFRPGHIQVLQDVFHQSRLKVWAEQPADFFEQAIMDMDSTLVETTGKCKQGMDIAYDGTWGYHPLILSLANTREVLSVVNRSGNRPSAEGAAEQVDRCLKVCFQGGFRKVLLRGDTAFSQTEHLDRWNADRRVRFLFGYDARANVVELAEQLPERAWKPLDRTKPKAIGAVERPKPEKVKDRMVKRREFQTLRLKSEQVAEFTYQPVACEEEYRMIVVRKNISKEKGEQHLYDEIRYFFYLTNDWVLDADEIVFLANDRCDQENLLSQLLSGCHALHAPVDNLESNWAYMVMTALAWNLKAWLALSVPETPGRWREKQRSDKRRLLGMEFRTFVQAFVRLPCQLVRAGRRLIYRLLSWNPNLPVFFRVVQALGG